MIKKLGKIAEFENEKTGWGGSRHVNAWTPGTLPHKVRGKKSIGIFSPTLSERVFTKVLSFTHCITFILLI